MVITRRVNLGMALFPVAIAATLVVLYVVATEISAVKDIYALLGLLVAAAIYCSYYRPIARDSV